MKYKIFCVGLQRTGTTSLYFALKELGYKTAPDSIPLFYNNKDRLLKKYDAFLDNPIPLLYQQLDQNFPNSKFILTTRSLESWLKSVQWLFQKELKTLNVKLKDVADEIHEEFYGTKEFDENMFKAKWETYHAELFQYFNNRKKDLLVLDLSIENDWEPLCEFLSKEVPKKPFPHKNRSR